MQPDLTFEAFVQERGRLVSMGSAERGLLVDDALRALRLAQSERRAILGGDAYSALNGKIVHALATWHVERRSGENYIAFVDRSVAESAEYIRHYPSPAQATPLFVLVASEVSRL